MHKQKQNIESLQQIRTKMSLKSTMIKQFQEKVNEQLNAKHNQKKYWGIHTNTKRLIGQSHMSHTSNFQKEGLHTNLSLQNQSFNIFQNNHIFSKQKQWKFVKSKQKVNLNFIKAIKYYPPSCSGFDITYSKLQDAIYIYGGISCSCQLEAGLKNYFYKYKNQIWTQVKSQSIYAPIPRYGHTFTSYGKDLILFGGVSEYKDKLKDRCFYSDIAAFHTTKNIWRVVETSGQFPEKTRKNHAACMLYKYYFVFGGINQNQEVIKDLSWINYQTKRPRWKTIHIQPRFNHKMISVQYPGRQFLAIFGGRNKQSNIINSLKIIPISLSEGDIICKDPIQMYHQIAPRQMPVMQKFNQGFIIFGGHDQDNQVVQDSWHYNLQKQRFQKLEIDLEYNQLRGHHGVVAQNDKMVVLAMNSKKYKMIQLKLER